MKLPEGFKRIAEANRTYFKYNRETGQTDVLCHIPGPIVGLRVKKRRWGGASHAIATETGRQYYIEDDWNFFTFEGDWTLSGDEFPEPTKEENE